MCMKARHAQLAIMIAVLAAWLMVPAQRAAAASAAEIDRKVELALQALYARDKVAKSLGETATAVLVFPDIVKGGLLIGGQFGNGALVRDGKIVGYYRSVAVSYGLQAGAQSFGYALFFMNDQALGYLDSSGGWEVGVGPTLTVLDKGAAASFSTTTTKDDIYALFFDQKGLMAGIGIQGSKISKIEPTP